MKSYRIPFVFISIIFLLSQFGLIAYGQSASFMQKVNASDPHLGDSYGSNVAVNGTHAVVCAHNSSFNEMGMDSLFLAGSAYVLLKDAGGNWNEIQKVVASDRAEEDGFASSAAIQDSMFAISAIYHDFDALGGDSLYNTGAVYIFEQDLSGGWNEVQKIVHSDRIAGDQLGFTVVMKGNTMMVSAHGQDFDAIGGDSLFFSGAAYVFERDTLGMWMEVQKLVPSDRGYRDIFGAHIVLEDSIAFITAINEDHNALGLDSVHDAGSVYIYEKSMAGTWNEVQKIVPGDRQEDVGFGKGMALQGNTILISSPDQQVMDSSGAIVNNAGTVFAFEQDSLGTWVEKQQFSAPDAGYNACFGRRISIDGDFAIIGALGEVENAMGGDSIYFAGACYLYQRNSMGVWEFQQKILSPDRSYFDLFGGSVTSAEGQVFIGATREEVYSTATMDTLDFAGAVFIYRICDLFDNTISSMEDTLFANEPEVSYQWIDCMSNLDIPGATDSFYVPTVNGDYAVTMSTTLGCVDTSVCETVLLVNQSELAEDFKGKVYPNPIQASLYVDLSQLEQYTHYVIRGVNGNRVQQGRLFPGKLSSLDLTELTPGAYIFELIDGSNREKRSWIKLIKTE